MVQALSQGLERDRGARSLAIAIGTAWVNQAAGRPAKLAHELYCYVAFRAGMERRALNCAGRALLSAAAAACEAVGDEALAARVPDLLAFRNAPGEGPEGGPEDESEDNDAPGPLRPVAGPEDEPEPIPKEEPEPDTRPEEPVPEGSLEPERKYRYRFLFDLFDVKQETPGAGDDELRYFARGRVIWADGTQQPILVQSAEKQDINTGDILSVIDPDRRRPKDSEHLIRRAESLIAPTGRAELFFDLDDFDEAEFTLELFEVDDTGAITEAFELLLSLVEFAESVAGLFNPVVALQQILQDAEAQNKEEARRAVTILKRILDRLAENLSLGEQPFYIDRATLLQAKYEPSARDPRLEVALKQQEAPFEGEDRDRQLLWRYLAYLRFERRPQIK